MLYPKYEIGQNLYAVEVTCKTADDNHIKCGTCNSLGIIRLSKVSNELFLCPVCQGKSANIDNHIFEVSIYGKVSRITTEEFRDAGKNKIKYILMTQGNEFLFDEDRLFISIEDAKKFCDTYK